MKIKLIKFNKELITPKRAHYNDAGVDCYALDIVELPPLTPVMIPLGFGLEVPDGYQAIIKPRSSMNAKGIISQIGTIDSGYRGEIKAVLINTSQTPFAIMKGDKICQIIIEPVILADFVEDLQNDRGVGGFGSTGK